MLGAENEEESDSLRSSLPQPLLMNLVAICREIAATEMKMDALPLGF